ncbi:putative GPR1/FUN34/yaaH family, partial [Leishmania naiffi]
ESRPANPGPVGLLGFGLSTILLNLHNTGRFPLSTVIVAMGIALGGGAQVIVGLLEWVRGNTFAHVAFTSYGAFWLSLVLVWLLPNTAARSSSIVEPASEYFVGVYLVLWGIFSFLMLMCTIRMNVAIFIVFLTVTLLFLMLGFANMTGNQTALRVAGYEGVICGSTALYLAFAEILNEVWDRTILPVIPMTQLLDWLVMLMCTIRMNVAIFIVFLTVTLLFLMLGFANMTGNQTALRVAGYEGVICGSTALYLAFAEILNEVWDRTILPVIPMTQLLDWLGVRRQKPEEVTGLNCSVPILKNGNN